MAQAILVFEVCAIGSHCGLMWRSTSGVMGKHGCWPIPFSTLCFLISGRHTPISAWPPPQMGPDYFVSGGQLTDNFNRAVQGVRQTNTNLLSHWQGILLCMWAKFQVAVFCTSVGALCGLGKVLCKRELNSLLQYLEVQSSCWTISNYTSSLWWELNPTCCMVKALLSGIYLF